MYDGAVAAAIEMFQLNPPVSSIPNAFPRYVVRALSPPEKPIKSPPNRKGPPARSRPRKAYRKGRNRRGGCGHRSERGGLPAKFGRTGFRRNFFFHGEWLGPRYATKQVEAYAVEEDGWLVITVIVKYF